MNSFDFVAPGGIYTAKEISFGRYYIFPKYGSERRGSEWSHETVKRYIDGGDWTILPYKVEKPKNQFTIKQGQIEAAARFVVANNKYMHYHTVDSMSVKIKSYIKDMIDKINSGKESYYCSTAGFTISIGLEDENYYVVEVLVSPDVSVDEEFVNVEEII